MTAISQLHFSLVSLQRQRQLHGTCEMHLCLGMFFSQRLVLSYPMSTLENACSRTFLLLMWPLVLVCAFARTIPASHLFLLSPTVPNVRRYLVYLPYSSRPNSISPPPRSGPSSATIRYNQTADGSHWLV